MIIFKEKLKALKAKFRAWNIESFGNVNLGADDDIKELNILDQEVADYKVV